MAPSIRLVAFLSAVALQVGLSTSADTTISLLVAEVPLSTRVEASIITVIQSLSETRLRISCPDYDGVENNPPCNVIHGATVTMNPGGVTMSVSRDGNRVTIPAENIEIALETNLVV